MGTFSDVKSFLPSFRTEYLEILAAHHNGELSYLKARQDKLLHGQKAFMRARDDVQAFLMTSIDILIFS